MRDLSSFIISSSEEITKSPLSTFSKRGISLVTFNVLKRIKSGLIAFSTSDVSSTCSFHHFLPPMPSTTYSESSMPDFFTFLPDSMCPSFVTPLFMYVSRKSFPDSKPMCSLVSPASFIAFKSSTLSRLAMVLERAYDVTLSIVGNASFK